MYCKQCGFHSFDHLQSCPKCGQNWETTRKILGLQWIEEPQENWLALPEKTENDSDRLVTVIPQPFESTAFTGAEDDFVLEEEWELSSEAELGEASLAEETFVFDEDAQDPAAEETIPHKGANTAIASERPATSQENRTKEQPGLPDDDLLVPGLEEMLKEKHVGPVDSETPETGPSPQDSQEPLCVSLEEDTPCAKAESEKSQGSSLPDNDDKSSEDLILHSEDLEVPGLDEKIRASGQPEAPTPKTGTQETRVHDTDEEVLEIFFEEPANKTSFPSESRQSASSHLDHQEIDLEELDISLDEKNGSSNTP
ncbi:hypothetical protein ACTVJH_10215 [Desulfoplanes sp. PS50]